VDILSDDEVNDDLLGTKLILDCDAPSGKMNFSLSSVFVRPLAATQTTTIIQSTSMTTTDVQYTQQHYRYNHWLLLVVG